MPSVPGMVEAEVLDPLCALVSVTQNRLLWHGLVLLRDLHYKEILYQQIASRLWQKSQNSPLSLILTSTS